MKKKSIYHVVKEKFGRMFRYGIFLFCDFVAEYYFRCLEVTPITGADFSYVEKYKPDFMKWMDRRNKWYEPGFCVYRDCD